MTGDWRELLWLVGLPVKAVTSVRITLAPPLLFRTDLSAAPWPFHPAVFRRFSIRPQYWAKGARALESFFDRFFLRTSVLVVESIEVKWPAKMQVGHIAISNPYRSANWTDSL